MFATMQISLCYQSFAINSQCHKTFFSNHCSRKIRRGYIFSCVRPLYEQAVSDKDRSMHRSLWAQVAHSLFIEGSHVTKNTASCVFVGGKHLQSTLTFQAEAQCLTLSSRMLHLCQFNRQTANWHGPPALFWLHSHAACYHLAVAPQLGVKDQFYRTLYYITLDPICVAQRASKNLKEMQKIRLEAKMNRQVICVKILNYKRIKLCLKVS